MAECNDYEGLTINPTPSSIGNQYAGVSTSDKPTGVPTYSIYLELDTGKFYYYDGAEWQEIPCSCSGGGGDEPSSENFKIKLSNDIDSAISADKVGISMGGISRSLQDLIDENGVTIDSDNIVTFPDTANGFLFNFEYIDTTFSYGLSSDDAQGSVDMNHATSNAITIAPNIMYFVWGDHK